MQAKKVYEAIEDILKPKSQEEIDIGMKKLLDDLRDVSLDPEGDPEELSYFLQNIYRDRKKLINDLMDEGLHPDDLLVIITDMFLDIKNERDLRFKLKMMGWMYNLIKKNKDKIDINDIL